MSVYAKEDTPFAGRWKLLAIIGTIVTLLIIGIIILIVAVSGGKY